MILFLFGEDNYRLKQKVKALKEKFISASLGDTNLAVLDGEGLTYDRLVREVMAFPFISKTRLVIVENIFPTSKKGSQNKDIIERVPEMLAKVPSSTVLVFAQEGVPDKRTGLYKKLDKEKAEEFKLLEPDQLRRWIVREIENRESRVENQESGIKNRESRIANEAVTKLIEYVGNDLWRMEKEIEKLSSYQLSVISIKDVELLVQPQTKSDIFNLIDKIAAKNIQAAMQELYRLLDSGENELYIFTMIIYQYRNLLIVKDQIERGTKNRWDLAKKLKMHPFVLGKTMALSSQYSLENLKKIYQKLLDFDIKIKTGKIEVRAGLELLIYQLT